MNEEGITRELKRGNLEIFSEIVDLYKNRVFACAYKFTNDYNEAQDLSQEIFIKIYKQINTFRFECKLSTWIYKVSTNLCIDWKKKNSRIKIVNISDYDKDISSFTEMSYAEKEIPEEKIIGLEDQNEIHRTIHNLPDKYKTVIIMYHFNDMSYKEISKTLDVPEKTVETRLYRARRMLRDELENIDYGGGFNWTAKKY